MIDNKVRCQSCGMPLGMGFFGTNLDGTVSDKYCKYCFEKGEFREPRLTVDEMMGRSVAHMIDEQGMSQEEAEVLAKSVIPTLERWQQSRQ